MYIPVVSANPFVSIGDDTLVADKAFKNTNVDPEPFVIVVFTPVISLTLVVKLLNDGVTFVVGFVRLTVTLHAPTVNPYDKFLRPPENTHWIALVP